MYNSVANDDMISVTQLPMYVVSKLIKAYGVATYFMKIRDHHYIIGICATTENLLLFSSNIIILYSTHRHNIMAIYIICTK